MDWVILGGFSCGALAGAAARYGRLCTMSAIEDALVARDLRGLKAWGLALATAIALTQLAIAAGAVDPARNLYVSGQLHLLGTLLGGLLFGLGMTLVGTCSFGLVVRAGSGDLRAAFSAMVVGICAFAVTSGALAPLRTALLDVGMLSLAGPELATLNGVAARAGRAVGVAVPVLLVLALLAAALGDARLRARPRLLLGAVAMGAAVAAGWWTTSRAVEDLALDRAESLSFVAPVGRALLQLMMDAFRNVGFGVAAMLGVAAASCLVAALRGELRWEAFDDALEMRRHIGGAALMGVGGVLAQGCTIGQGLSAASMLAVSAPLFLIAVVVGARVGLWHLIEGRSLWRLGLS